ncbi:hypothetical protein Dfri01_59390 [Dyadobacter frigoris]|uniref:phosphoadenosine phosphosulfate reductase domain-containing protein n=1 Tax=Dyadobacter frigoris TaxID=2576211 RepID=UPI0024A06ABF|nr:phosphoadenosine phosphosulfate reductase family protein [Dyadobacter frigoris]GLU56478.1 hypothetical protein Dfri01_59390 [Dyadobacter frigoris]
MKNYDKYIVAFSGGKDSTACFLYLLSIGIDVSKIELWHHLVDGQEETFMDWEVTEDYCRKFAEAFGVQIYFSWKEGGFERELLRENARTAPMIFETPSGLVKAGGERGKLSTRRKFPQVSGDLSVRWCSPYLKIQVCAAAIRNQDRFKGLKTVVLSGERGQESIQRSKYRISERDEVHLDNKRVVHRWRPIRDWNENAVWAIIEKYNVVAHPCYYLGWTRCSCKFCIFGNADQMASASKISPIQSKKIISYERAFATTIKRNESFSDLVERGVPYQQITESSAMKATSKIYSGAIFTNNWSIPAGAYGSGCGP